MAAAGWCGGFASLGVRSRTWPRRWGSPGSARTAGWPGSAAEGWEGLPDRSSTPASQPGPDPGRARPGCWPTGQEPAGARLDRPGHRRARPARCPGSCPATGCRAWPTATRSPGSSSGPRRHARPLRARAARRPDPHRRQEDREDPRPAAGGAPTAARSARPVPPKRTRIGYDYVHSAIDDHSRLAYSEILPDEKGPTCAGFLDRAAAWFAAQGITVDQPGPDRQRPGPTRDSARPAPPYWPASALPTSSSSRTAPGRTAKPSASTAPCKPNGPTGTCSPATTQRAPPSRPGSTTTTMSAAHTALGGHPPISRIVSPT